ncbi:hypothetical protein R8Z50_14235 [Longispora sp. K20-0274]|uniref:hypothetical protein n=1 Tax=Longispora sp. K20-0274 TaxID=3088255 RepID=UPI00399A9D4A
MTGQDARTTDRVLDLGVIGVDPPSPTVPAARRRGRALVLAAGVVVLVVLAVVAATRPGPAAPRQPAGPPDRNLTVFADDRLYLPDGTQSSMGKRIDAVYETPDGLLVSYEPAGDSWHELAFVSPNHRFRTLVDRATGPVLVAPDGQRIAWAVPGALRVAFLGPDGTVRPDRSTPVPEGTRGTPVLFTGSAVVLGRGSGSGVTEFDVWLPDRGDYLPSWTGTTHVTGMYSQYPGSFDLIGAVGQPGSDESCLARLDPEENLRPVRTACGVPLMRDNVGRISPDGRWLAVRTPDRLTGSPCVGVFDLDTVFDRPGLAATWDATEPGGWLDATTMSGPRGDGHLWTWRTDGTPPTRVGTPGLPDPDAVRVGFATRLW